ncbi:MAG: hypothetical protein ACXADC_00740 [Candidatus Thorarchaeota archaeon]
MADSEQKADTLGMILAARCREQICANKRIVLRESVLAISLNQTAKSAVLSDRSPMIRIGR